MAEYVELSRHTGFDPRLCHGDITLGFRFFAQGLPDNCVRNVSPTSSINQSATLQQNNLAAGDLRSESADNQHPLLQNNAAGRGSPILDLLAAAVSTGTAVATGGLMESPSYAKTSLIPLAPLYFHKWTPIHLKHGIIIKLLKIY